MKSILLPLLAAIAYAASILFAKVGLTRRRISIKDYIPGVFFFLSFFSILALIRWGGVNSSKLLVAHNLWLLISIIIVAAVWNVLYYIGLSKEKVNTTEGIIILMPLGTIVLSWLFTPQNYDPKIALSALGATLLVALAYRPSSLLRVDIYNLMLFTAVILMALENVLVGQLLKSQSISPAALYAIRTVLVFVIFYLYYRPSLGRLGIKTLAFLAISGLIGTSAMLFRFYGLRDAGITLTAIILILVPVFVFSAAILFLHEKMKFGRLSIMLAIGVLIVYASLVNYDLLAHK